MGIALYGEDGFFATGPVRSSEMGDFLTSPEVSPWFGRIVGRCVAAAVAGMERPHLIEVGAGTGSLLASLLESTDAQVEAWAVEASPMAREALRSILGKERVTASLDEVPQGQSGVILANELIDNLPVSLAVRRGDGWDEHLVVTDGESFDYVSAPARPQVAAWAEDFGGAVPEGGIVEVQLAAGEWLLQAMGMIERGSIILIDYGGTIEELEPRRRLGTMRTYRGHHLGPDPLLEPGQTDITVDVNFSALEALARASGARVTLQRQDDFLTSWGLRDVVSDLRHRELEAARQADTMTQLVIRTDRIAAETLLHPRGLGDFRVLTIQV
ncbi:MAG: SAM-dependent methyltransferase [Actinomycetota bacterium]|nr:SAM-dependent methyltransferase [Actinomycetota bacterium]